MDRANEQRFNRIDAGIETLTSHIIRNETRRRR
jgi:hypothetical protein